MARLHHNCTSEKFNWVAYDEESKTLEVSFKPKGSVYKYFDVPPQHFGNIMHAKSRNKAIGAETPGSEGSYIIHHIVGKDRKNPPYRFEKVAA